MPISYSFDPLPNKLLSNSIVFSKFSNSPKPALIYKRSCLISSRPLICLSFSWVWEYKDSKFFAHSIMYSLLIFNYSSFRYLWSGFQMMKNLSSNRHSLLLYVFSNPICSCLPWIVSFCNHPVDSLHLCSFSIQFPLHCYLINP